MANFFDTWRSGGTGVGAYTLKAGSASQVPLVAQGFLGQTANLLELKNAAGTNVFYVDVSGNVYYLGDEYITDQLTVHGNAQIDSALNVTGATTLSTLSTSGLSTLGSLSVTGASHFTGDGVFGHNLSVNNSFNLNNYGYFNRSVYFAEQASAPSAVAEKGAMYTKDASSVTELFYLNSSGSEVQLTSGGAIGGDDVWIPDDDTLGFGNTAAAPDITMSWVSATNYLNVDVPATGRIYIDGTTTRTGTAELLDIDATINTTTATDDVLVATLTATRNSGDSGATRGLTVSVTTGDMADTVFSYGIMSTVVTSACTHNTSDSSAFAAGAITADPNCRETAFLAQPGYDLGLWLMDSSIQMGSNNLENDCGTFTMIKGAQASDPQVQFALSADANGDFSITADTGDITLTAADDFFVSVDGNLELGLTGTVLYPYTSDGLALGDTTHMWADLFLNTAGVINFNNGELTITEASTGITFAGTGMLNTNITQAAGTGVPVALTITGGAHTAITGATEDYGVNFNFSANKTWATGAGPLATQREVIIQAPTYIGNAGGALTITKAATFAITNAPTQGANITLSNAYALWVQAGSAQFDGGIVTTSGTFTSLVVAPTATGNVLDFQLETEFTTGSIINADYGSATVQSGDLTGIYIDFNANLSGVTDLDTNGVILKTQALTQAVANTTNYTGFSIPTAGALVQSAGAGTINWYGAKFQMPNLTQTTGTVTSYGLHITGGTITSGTEYGIYLSSCDAYIDGNLMLSNGSYLGTGKTASDILYIGAYDTNTGPAYTAFITLTAGNTPACAFSGDITGVTQSAGDNSTKLATTAYVDAAVLVEDIWDRTGTVISPNTAGDSVEGLSAISATLAATGNLTLDGRSTPTTNTSGIIDLNLTTATNNVSGLNIDAINTKTTGQTVYGAYIKTSSTAVLTGTPANYYGIYTEIAKTGADNTADAVSTYGIYSTVSYTGAADQGTKSNYAGYFTVVGDTAGTSTNYAVYATAASADTNYAFYAASGKSRFLGQMEFVWSENVTDAVTIETTALSTGSALVITGPSGATAGVTDAFVKITTDIGNCTDTTPTFGVISSTATIDTTGATDTGVNLFLSTANTNSTNANSSYGIYNATTDAIALANTNYGSYTSVANTGAIDTAITKTIYGSYITASGTGGGPSSAGTTKVYGQYITTTATHAADFGTVNQYGLYVANGTSSTNGTSDKYGVYIETPTGADTNYIIYSPNFSVTGAGVMAGVTSIGVTGTRIANGFFTDLAVTNTITGSISGNAATVTTNANLTGDVTSVGNATTLANISGAVTMTENAYIGVDSSLSADGKFNGITIDGTAGAILAFGDLCYLDPTDSKWELTDANAAAGADGDSRGVLGICVLAAAENAATRMLLYGVVRADTAFPAITVNGPVYVDETAGDIVVTQPITADVVIRVVGFGLDANSILFCPSPDYITHA